MSGIVGVLSLRGEPLESSFLRTLTEHMAFRGPDAQHMWVGDGIGLGHALLSVAPQANSDRQPFSLNGDLWIVADARLDGRTDLLAALQSAGQVSPAAAGDAELILHAYAAWGEGCLNRLLGDFSFAIWDGRRKSLFCARDHMGVKPFYYALGEQWLVFSNTLDCVRMQPWASADLNELSVGEFLLFGAIQDRAATIFSRIQRLPSGHSLAWHDGKLVVRRVLDALPSMRRSITSDRRITSSTFANCCTGRSRTGCARPGRGFLEWGPRFHIGGGFCAPRRPAGSACGHHGVRRGHT